MHAVSFCFLCFRFVVVVLWLLWINRLATIKFGTTTLSINNAEYVSFNSLYDILKRKCELMIIICRFVNAALTHWIPQSNGLSSRYTTMKLTAYYFHNHLDIITGSSATYIFRIRCTWRPAVDFHYLALFLPAVIYTHRHTHTHMHHGGSYMCVVHVGKVAVPHTPSCLLMMPSSNGKIFRVTGPFCVEFTGLGIFPHTKACDAELCCFLWSAGE